MYRVFGYLAPKDDYIIWLSHLLTLNVLDEDYSRSAWYARNYI